MTRTIYIGNPAYLRLKDNQLKIIDPESKSQKGSIPIEDIAYLILDHPQITLSNYLLTELTQASCLVLTCDHQHLPLGILAPMSGHKQYTARIRMQTEVSKALKKNIWKQTVIAKIQNQAAMLEEIEENSKTIRELIPRVLSGDKTNCEAVAARYYWGRLFDNFRRDRKGETPNDLLNYGYAILMSIVARSLCMTGFHLALGVQHSNKYNPYCLANDLMEPYRPFVDRMVYEMQEYEELSREAKAELLTLPQIDTYIDGKNRPLQIAVEISARSLLSVYKGEIRQLKYPEM